MVSDDSLLIKQLGLIIPYLTLFLSVFFYKKYKNYKFYIFFIIYNITIVIVDILTRTIFVTNSITLFNFYTFFEFNSLGLIYFHLINEKKKSTILKFLILGFNIVYILSFYFDYYVLYTIPLEGIVNSVIIILFFIELLNSERILNYKKLFPFWMSVAFLIFYLTSVPFWSLYYSSIFETRAMFPIIYYLATLLNVIFIYGLVTCKKTESLY